MKLSHAQVEQIEGQLEAQAVPDDHPAASQLEGVFGGHTFFLRTDGLHVVERAGPTDSGSHAASVVKLASWEDEEKTRLIPHGAEAVGIVELSDDETGPKG